MTIHDDHLQSTLGPYWSAQTAAITSLLNKRIAMPRVRWFLAENNAESPILPKEQMQVMSCGRIQGIDVKFKPWELVNANDVLVIPIAGESRQSESTLRVRFLGAGSEAVADSGTWLLKSVDVTNPRVITGQSDSNSNSVSFASVPAGCRMTLECPSCRWFLPDKKSELEFTLGVRESRNADIVVQSKPTTKLSLTVLDSLGRPIDSYRATILYGNYGFVEMHGRIPAEPCRLFVTSFGYEQYETDLDLSGNTDAVFSVVLRPSMKGELRLSF
jgi:hypothetical protein